MILGNLAGGDGLVLLVVIVVALFFGGKKIPELARSLGSATAEFKKGAESSSKQESEHTDPPKSE